MRRLLAVLAVTVVVIAARAGHANQPAQPGGDLPDFVVSELRVQEFPAKNYLYLAHQTTLAQIGPVIQESMQQFEQVIRQNQAQVEGAPIFVYKGATGEMDKPFELHIGFPVAEGTTAEGDMKVRMLEKFRCATVLYSGGVKDIGQAYGKIFADIQQAGLEPIGESREMHLYWESPESTNNVALIMVGVK